MANGNGIFWKWTGIFTAITVPLLVFIYVLFTSDVAANAIDIRSNTARITSLESRLAGMESTVEAIKETTKETNIDVKDLLKELRDER